MGNKPIKQRWTETKKRLNTTRPRSTQSTNYENTPVNPKPGDEGEYTTLAPGGTYEEIRNLRVRHELFVVALDIGTSSSGYAISVYDEYKRDPLQISTFSWRSRTDGFQHFKTLSAVLLNPDGELHSIGYDAEYHYINFLSEDERQEWFYFQHFKMRLYDQKISRDLVLHDVKGKPQKALKIFSSIIKGLKDDFTTRLKERISNFGGDSIDEDIHWVITVPAIWDEKAKQFMRVAAQKAGILNDKLSIALEPEAAALYCRYLPVERLTRPEDLDGKSKLKTFSPGAKYLIVDLGGGTVDITAHEILPNGALQEVMAASGGNWGSLAINEEFVKYLENLTVPGITEIIRREHPDDLLSFMSAFENKKRVFSKEDERVILQVPQSFRDIMSEKLGKSPESHVEEINKTQEVKFQRDKMYIYNEAFTNLLKGTIEKIILHVLAILESHHLHVESIVLVGGFAESDLLKSTFRTSFPDTRIIVPEDPVLAVLKGAVLFGRNPQVLQARVCRYTYGVCTTVDFDETRFPPDKKIVLGGNALAKDIFNIHIRANETVHVGQRGTPKRYFLNRADQEQLDLEIFATKNSNPKYVTEEGVVSLGLLVIMVPKAQTQCNDKRHFLVSFLLDGTEMEVEAVDSVTNETTGVKFDFIG
ncbi:heat shock 70 kDa protein 12A-like [Saccostrea cucullata]|uniref:heat shock 70 kDa protein 12A-like n=1 Tax=Saccostrea cuccullata TaxID=36930 RepID=UPI002ED3D2D9